MDIKDNLVTPLPEEIILPKKNQLLFSYIIAEKSKQFYTQHTKNIKKKTYEFP
jgi:hypothetical protein